VSATVQCPACAALAVLPAPAVLELAGAVLFWCRSCRRVVEKTVERDAPVGHPEAPPPGPPLRSDDLLELDLLLATEGWLAGLGGEEDES
jgi:hypothetical protein